MTTNKDKYFQINSIVKLFRMLDTLVSKSEWELAKLANEINIPKTTVLRMLLTLKSLGYVDQTELGKRYYATAKLFEIGSKAIPNINILNISQPIMARLADKCDETVYLSVLSGIDIVVVAKISSRHYLKVDSYVGDRIKSYQSSSGKALLTGMSSKHRAEMFNNHQFEQVTTKGISSLAELEAELSKILARGYSLVDEEKYIGIRSVAVPIFDHRNETIAALSAVAPKVRLKMKNIPQLAGLVTEAANEITQKLGGTNVWSLSRN